MSAYRSPAATLNRLTTARWALLSIVLLLVVFAPIWLDLPLPRGPLLTILALAACWNWRTQGIHRDTLSLQDHRVFREIVFDISTLSALLFFTGGATNPLIFLLLPPVATAALLLPPLWSVMAGFLALLAYSTLMLAYWPLMLNDPSRATRLHLGGMWLTFAASTALILWLVLRLGALLRQRDTELAQEREHALRDERILALGTLAAGTAHELGTPLASMTLLAEALQQEQGLSSQAQTDITTLHSQIQACKAIITRLTHRGGAERLENTQARPAQEWLGELHHRWQRQHPEANSRLDAQGSGPCPSLAVDPTLEHALINLLNNAARACPDNIEIHLQWQAPSIDIIIRDHGPGFSPQALKEAGHTPFQPHAHGQGVGLLLTRSTIERRRGSLSLSNAPDGGAIAHLQLPTC